MRKSDARGIVAMTVLTAMLVSGCSVGMALSGKAAPNLGAFRVGSTRGEVELHLGSPVDSVTRPDGGRTDIYEYELGNKPSTGRAVGHAVMDLLTFGVWEIIGTPIEAIGIEKKRLMIVYDDQDRILAINQAPPVKASSPKSSEPEPE
ncbi:hypothetical protein LCGC14_1807240 [marine sediment metagenome]|uniref:Uncharacterized protein n=1 Tax=marine sediment metagenome TaxID=412755 RepID=A0A0F9GMN7_9ZZZZ